jgi:hypothetical protein
VREAHEVRGLRLAELLHRPVLGHEAAELDQAGLLGVQGQAELWQPLPEIAEEPLDIVMRPEADDGVVGVADVDAYVGSRTVQGW